MTYSKGWSANKKRGHPRSFCENNLDTLTAALYVKIDDLLKASPEQGLWRPAVGLAPKLSDAELITLAVIQALRGFTSESRWLRFARAHMTHLFRYLPQQSGYNKRLRAAAGLLMTVIRLPAADTTLYRVRRTARGPVPRRWWRPWTGR